MIVILKNTESKLMNELRKCRDVKTLQRCFFLEFSSLDIPKHKVFETFLRMLQEVPDSYMAQIYVCRDADVFILMQGFMQRQFTDFLERLSEALNAPNLAELSKVYEIGRDWISLEMLCAEKLEMIDQDRKQEKEVRRKEASEKATIDVLSTLDPDLVSSISRRRLERLSTLVLIVDDDQLSRTLAGNVLREKYQPAFARDGKSALEEFVSLAPDIVFLDIGMPDIGGHEVLESLFQIDPEAYVIMFSGRKDKENMMRALETGAQGFLGKPFTREKLFQHVEKSPFVQKKTERNPAPGKRRV